MKWYAGLADTSERVTDGAGLHCPVSQIYSPYPSFADAIHHPGLPQDPLQLPLLHGTGFDAREQRQGRKRCR